MAVSLINMECKRYGCMKNLLACYANCRYNSRCDDLRGEVLPKFEQAANDINAYRQERGLSTIEIQVLKRGLKFVDVATLQKNLAKEKKAIERPSPAKKPKRKTKSRKTVGGTRRIESPKAGFKPVQEIDRQPAVAEKRAVRVLKKKTANGKQKAVVSLEQPYSIAPKRLTPVKKKIKSKPETDKKMSKKGKDLPAEALNESKENIALASPANPLNLMNNTEKTAAPHKRKGNAQDASAKKKKKLYIILDGEKSALVDEKGLMTKLLAGVSPNARYFEATEIELRLQVSYKK
jgi:hypothetical protein